MPSITKILRSVPAYYRKIEGVKAQMDISLKTVQDIQIKDLTSY
jgi:hypothetical protein